MSEIETNSAAMPMKSRAGSCRRCGTCCLKGGPALHLADRELVEAGHIPLKHLMTIRKCEPAFDNVTGRCEPAPSDIIKIAGSSHAGRTCIFFDRAHTACMIYDHRPVECRALACWDTAALEALYNVERLTRRDLIGSVAGLWDLVADHQARCGYDRIAELSARFTATCDRDAADALITMIKYDIGLREVVSQRTPKNAEMLDFLFGQALSETIRRFGLRLVRTPANFTLELI